MSYSYERVERRPGRQQHGGRGIFGFWVPLAVTVTVATMGIAAWIWSERQDDEDDEEEEDYDRNYDRKGDGRDTAAPPRYGDVGPGETSFVPQAGSEETSGGVISRMSGALGRTPSPQQMYDGASRTVAAGMAAAGAAVGGALASIREEDKDDYPDHSRWSEEGNSGEATDIAGVRKGATRGANSSDAPVTGAPSASFSGMGPQSGGANARGLSHSAARRKTVAIVLSAESHSNIPGDEDDDGYHQEEASVLSHLPTRINPATTRLFVLIYAPDLKQHPSSGRPGESVTSSYSNISHDEARSPHEELDTPLTSVDPNPISSPALSASTSASYKALHAQARALVENDTMILPFTTASGHVHILRHLAPEIVYMQESLSGSNGDVVGHISGWVGQVIVVVGAEGGHGGLIDSEDEVALSKIEQDRWWQGSDRVGLGKGVEVVDGMRVGEDWAKRVGGLE
ncbi:MAG: hypothetical protein M1837_006977 [Sclerophora amabilis]|nr:MAG: hypothetical protein M1837_006977 [Sclerophora amabilis]